MEVIVDITIIIFIAQQARIIVEAVQVLLLLRKMGEVLHPQLVCAGNLLCLMLLIATAMASVRNAMEQENITILHTVFLNGWILARLVMVAASVRGAMERDADNIKTSF